MNSIFYIMAYLAAGVLFSLFNELCYKHTKAINPEAKGYSNKEFWLIVVTWPLVLVINILIFILLTCMAVVGKM